MFCEVLVQDVKLGIFVKFLLCEILCSIGFLKILGVIYLNLVLKLLIVILWGWMSNLVSYNEM